MPQTPSSSANELTHYQSLYVSYFHQRKVATLLRNKVQKAEKNVGSKDNYNWPCTTDFEIVWDYETFDVFFTIPSGLFSTSKM